MAQTDGAHAEARDVGRALAALLADEPALAALLPDGYVERAAAYAALLLEANRRLNLTRVTDARRGRPPAPARRAGGPAAGGRCAVAAAVDLGSGGGVPGIPLALARPDVRWILVDSVRQEGGGAARDGR